MDLLEYEGKRLLAEGGIAVPRGILWPALPEGADRFVVKAQIPAGRRGKQGGIRFAMTAEEAAGAASAIVGSRIGEFTVDRVYVEECIAVAGELYLALMLDRDECCFRFVASPHGGMEVEEADLGHVLTQAIDPAIGVWPFATRRLARHLGLPQPSAREFHRLAENLYQLALREDAILVEINPLVVSADGGLVAADAKLVIDDAALFRHQRWSSRTGFDSSTDLERALRAVGAVGIEVDRSGVIMAVVSGAGLMMTALDVLTSLGGRVRCVVDMQGLPLQGEQGIARLCQILAEALPEIILIGGRFQAPVADVFAAAIAQSLGGLIEGRRAIGWIAGNRSEEARMILAATGFQTCEDFRQAMVMATAGTCEPHGSRAAPAQGTRR
jgi:succinyl-CoA synthetase beta subunit